MNTDIEALKETVKKGSAKFHAAKEEIGKVIVGQTEMVNSLFISLLADGHLLIEGLPGLAKTLAVNTLAKTVQCDFKRIQFTPDLLPADLIGTSIYNPRDGSFSISKGPIFTHILLADEINRAPAKVQSALLEVMQERQVTISGTTFPVGAPYLVLATQNPIEHEGTYPLPESQTDRFMMKVLIGYPSREEEVEIVKRMATLGKLPHASPTLTPQDIMESRSIVNQVYVDDKIISYILDIVFATRQPEQYHVDIKGMLLFGASPRASIALKLASQAHAFLSGRAFVTPQDIKHIGKDVLRHRLRRTYEAEAEGVTPDNIIDTVFSSIPIP